MGARAMRYFWASVTDLVGVTGFEPATSWSQTTRSTKLSYTPKLNVDSYHESGLFASRNLVTLEKLEMKTGSVFVLSVMLGYGAMLTLPAQVAAPPTVDLGSRKNQEAILTPTPTPPPDSPGSPNVSTPIGSRMTLSSFSNSRRANTLMVDKNYWPNNL